MKSIPRIVWFVPIILLIIATSHLMFSISHLLYGYYTFIRIVICGIAAIIAFVGFQDRSINQWPVLLSLIAVLFNPFIPIRLSLQVWFYLDYGTAAVFAAHLIFVRCAPYPLRVRRILQTLALVALVIAVGGGVLALLGLTVALIRISPGSVTDQDIQYLPWMLGGNLLFVLGGGAIIRYLLKNPTKDDGRDTRSEESNEPRSTLHIN